MTSVDEILNYKRKEGEDFYSILGCDENSSVEQITTEYKVRALQYHPDKNSGDKEAEQKFQQLKEAKEVLCDPEKRSNYDKWKNSGISISYKQWLGMKEHVHQSMHWSTPKTKDRMLESGVSSGPSSLGSGSMSAAQRRASEGGANLHWGGRGAGAVWGNEAPSEIIMENSGTKNMSLKDRRKVELALGGCSGVTTSPSASLLVGGGATLRGPATYPISSKYIIKLARHSNEEGTLYSIRIPVNVGKTPNNVLIM